MSTPKLSTDNSETAGVDNLVAEKSYKMGTPVIRFAPQDAPVPPQDPKLLPKNAYFVTSAAAELIIKNASARPTENCLSDVVLSMEDEYTEKHARLLVREYWKAVKPGFSLFIPADFPAQINDTAPKRSHVEGYKKYTK